MVKQSMLEKAVEYFKKCETSNKYSPYELASLANVIAQAEGLTEIADQLKRRADAEWTKLGRENKIEKNK